MKKVIVSLIPTNKREAFWYFYGRLYMCVHTPPHICHQVWISLWHLKDKKWHFLNLCNQAKCAFRTQSLMLNRNVVFRVQVLCQQSHSPKSLEGCWPLVTVMVSLLLGCYPKAVKYVWGWPPSLEMQHPLSQVCSPENFISVLGSFQSVPILILNYILFLHLVFKQIPIRAIVELLYLSFQDNVIFLFFKNILLQISYWSYI